MFLERFKEVEYFTIIKLRLGGSKKVIKILSSNISDIYGPIILPSELDWELSKFTSTRNFEAIKWILLPVSLDIVNVLTCNLLSIHWLKEVKDFYYLINKLVFI